jgi:hypothetical protein
MISEPPECLSRSRLITSTASADISLLTRKVLQAWPSAARYPAVSYRPGASRPFPGCHEGRQDVVRVPARSPRPRQLWSFWRCSILFRLNGGSYKLALGKALLAIADQGLDQVRLDDQAVPISRHICEHLEPADEPWAATSRLLITLLGKRIKVVREQGRQKSGSVAQTNSARRIPTPNERPLFVGNDT